MSPRCWPPAERAPSAVGPTVEKSATECGVISTWYGRCSKIAMLRARLAYSRTLDIGISRSRACQTPCMAAVAKPKRRTMIASVTTISIIVKPRADRRLKRIFGGDRVPMPARPAVIFPNSRRRPRCRPGSRRRPTTRRVWRCRCVCRGRGTCSRFPMGPA